MTSKRLRFKGPAGAEFVITPGAAFSERTIDAYVASGEWTPVKEPAPEPEKPKRTPRKKADPKPADD